MQTFWQKIQEYFKKAWHGLTIAGRIIGGLILIGVIGFVIYAVAKDDNKHDDKGSPEVAQINEPSIGTPLPPDVPGKDMKVSGAVTTESFQAPKPSDATIEGRPDSKVAPHTGADLGGPSLYEGVAPARGN